MNAGRVFGSNVVLFTCVRKKSTECSGVAGVSEQEQDLCPRVTQAVLDRHCRPSWGSLTPGSERKELLCLIILFAFLF